ncbi:alpha-hydroxy-acid oxidizing protein [Mesorhizobium ciceri]|nr:alpha-hydroxy-acid oxidizing protein [Mesorhizobium ciceri]
MAAARGSGVAQAVFTLGTTATAAIEDGVAVSQSPVWFLLYRQSNRGFNGTALGQAICVAVDMPKPGDRRRQFRAGFKIPDASQRHTPSTGTPACSKLALRSVGHADLGGYCLAAFADNPAAYPEEHPRS